MYTQGGVAEMGMGMAGKRSGGMGDEMMADAAQQQELYRAQVSYRLGSPNLSKKFGSPKKSSQNLKSSSSTQHSLPSFHVFCSEVRSRIAGDL